MTRQARGRSQEKAPRVPRSPRPQKGRRARQGERAPKTKERKPRQNEREKGAKEWRKKTAAERYEENRRVLKNAHEKTHLLATLAAHQTKGKRYAFRAIAYNLYLYARWQTKKLRQTFCPVLTTFEALSSL